MYNLYDIESQTDHSHEAQVIIAEIPHSIFLMEQLGIKIINEDLMFDTTLHSVIHAYTLHRLIFFQRVRK